MSQKPPQSALPTHLGIIPDGNRRWAKANGKLPLVGHQQGADIIEDICQHALDSGVRYVTMYAFSTENWGRPSDEIVYLMKLFERLVSHGLKKLEKRGVRLRWIGRPGNLTPSLIKAIEAAEARTAGNQNGTFAICLNYGGLQELADAAAGLAESDTPATPESLLEHLYAPDIPPLDLIIRTSGEQRTSGFMLARAAYSEFHFVDKHWPDFTTADLDVALADYAHRQRRFGS